MITRDVKVTTAGEFIKKRGVVGILGGIWAMIPDIDYFLEEHMFDKPWADIFFLHRTFDLVLPETDLFFAAQMFLLFAVVNLFALAASVKTFERVNEALFGKDEEEEEDEEDEDVTPEEARREDGEEKMINGALDKGLE